MRIRTMVVLVALARLGVCSSTSSAEDLFSGFERGWNSPWMERAMAEELNRFHLETESGNRFLRVESASSASALWRELAFDTTQRTIISWRWRVEKSLNHIDDERQRRSDDYAARVAVMFDGEPFERSTAVLMYVWAGNEDVGNVYPSPYTDRAATIVLQSGDPESGDWFHEARDVASDFESYFGRRPDRMTGIALIVDTDNTGSKSTAWFDDLTVRVEGR